MKINVNQTFFAVLDPQWGEPVVIPETIRPGLDAAKDAVLWMSAHSLYHGGSEVDAIKGKWAGLAAQGYKMVEFTIKEVADDQ